MSNIKYFILPFALLMVSQLLLAQKKALQLEDYDQWHRIVSVALSDDGQWMTYGLRPNGGDDTLKVKDLNDHKVVHSIPFAGRPVFSENSQWLAYIIQPNEKEQEKLKKSRKAAFNKAELLNLSTGDKKTYERAESMAFTKDGRFFALLRKKPEADKSKHKGQDLLLKNLQTGVEMNIGNVTEYAFNQKGTQLAYLVDAADQVGNGLYVLDLNSNIMHALDTDAKTYSQLAWDDKNAHRSSWSAKGNRLAVLKGEEADTLAHAVHSLLVFSGLNEGEPQKTVFEPKDASNFPQNMVISSNGELNFSENGQIVLFGMDEQEEKKEMSKDTLPNVDVFHWKDERINTVQQRRANRNKRFSYLCSFSLSDKKFTRLADEKMRMVLPSRHSQYWVGRDEKPYISDVNWGVSPADLYRVSLTDGKGKAFAKEVKRPVGYSPDGRYYLYQLDGQLHVYDLEQDKISTISKSAPVSFVDADHPYPHENPPYGVEGWTKDGKGVIVNHKYDLWYLSLDGQKATNITKGVGDKEEIEFNYVPLDPEAEYIDTQAPMLLSAYGEWTKKSGYFNLDMGKKPEKIVFDDKSIGRVQKARLADRLAFTQQTFVDFPDYYISNRNFENITKVTDANPQQKDYAWGSKVLVDYTNSKGEKLQGTLTLPPDYEPGKKYPMVVYFYEKMSQRHHAYSMPVYDDRPHASMYASNGYLFFMPDNVYEEGRPGTSALDCITSAVQKVIDLGYADPEKIGLQGHSWGGYQSSFILTQTDLFACVVTGAPPTDLESFYNNIYGNTGTNHVGIMEIGQVRMGRGVTPWSHREIYQRENPMFHAPNISTPFMILHGTRDGAVDWTQGLEFYNAARRLGKEVIFLSYPGEPHHLRNEYNQKDFQTRMKQYFDHYLMDKPAPQWLKEGIPHLEKVYDKAGQD
jgi:dipeptidyl aminopeptidase/acylaminoacyl peptidase